jgi:hypothetical protein
VLSQECRQCTDSKVLLIFRTYKQHWMFHSYKITSKDSPDIIEKY